MPKNWDSYPILTEDIGSDLSSPGSTTAPSGDFQKTVLDTMRNVLGIRVRSDDPSTFSKALSNAFTIVDQDGIQSYIYNPTSLTLDASNGDVTGLQKVLLIQAQDLVRTCTPLIKGLRPIALYVEEDVEPLRELTVSALEELAVEFGYPGGIRRQILETKFQILIGPNPAKPTQGVPWSSGFFADLKRVLKLEKHFTKFTDDERVFTDFLTAASMTYNLFEVWQNTKDMFMKPDQDRYLGELQYLLSRSLEVVHEKRMMLVTIANSVFVNPADLYNFSLPIHNGQLTFGEIIDGIDDAVTRIPNMLRQGGAYAVGPIGETLANFTFLVDQAKQGSRSPGIPDGYATDRFQTSVDELLRSLGYARSLVDSFNKHVPSVSKGAWK
jgi:hypothetical protein